MKLPPVRRLSLDGVFVLTGKAHFFCPTGHVWNHQEHYAAGLWWWSYGLHHTHITISSHTAAHTPHTHTHSLLSLALIPAFSLPLSRYILSLSLQLSLNLTKDRKRGRTPYFYLYLSLSLENFHQMQQLTFSFFYYCFLFTSFSPGISLSLSEKYPHGIRPSLLSPYLFLAFFCISFRPFF